MIIVNIMTGIAHIKKRRKLIGCPSRWASPATITLAEAAISEPLPPKHEPSESAHHTGIIASLPPKDGSMDFKVGIIVATNGMLSMAVETMAETHKTPKVAFLMLPSVISTNFCPSWCKIPVSSKP